MRTGNRDLIKQINHSITLNLIKSRGPLSRTEIARLSGLSLATISGLTGELLASGFIQEAGEGESTGGRPPVLLKLNAHGGFVVGLKLTERSIVIAIADLEANLLLCKVITASGLTDPKTAIKAITQAIESTLAESGVARHKLMGIGVGLAGVIDTRSGVCHYSPILGWREVQLGAELESRFKLPVYIENDVNTLTAAEQWFGVGRGVDHFLVVTIGRGIGLGIVVNGQLYRGIGGGAGEFGHLTMVEDGPLCGCGKHGCLETLAGDQAMQRMAEEAIAAGRKTGLVPAHDGAKLTIDEVAAAAKRGDQVAHEILAQAGHALGLGLSYLVNLFNPAMLVLSGEGVSAGDGIIGPARETMKRNIFTGIDAGLLVAVEPLGDEAWARGAACVVLGELFKHPIYKDERAWLPSRVA